MLLVAIQMHCASVQVCCFFQHVHGRSFGWALFSGSSAVIAGVFACLNYRSAWDDWIKANPDLYPLPSKVP